LTCSIAKQINKGGLSTPTGARAFTERGATAGLLRYDERAIQNRKQPKPDSS